MEVLEGNSGEVGSITKMRYSVMKGKREIDLIETILVNDLPEKFIGEYKGPGMVNTITSEFTSLGEGATRWTAEVHYTEVKAFMMKIMFLLAPKMFKNQTQQWLDRFKEHVENLS